jgi:hypothetical protein
VRASVVVGVGVGVGVALTHAVGAQVSRAFGDAPLKNEAKKGAVVVATPEIKVVALRPDQDLFALSACDGVGAPAYTSILIIVI